jgi:eukaryotic-like serine/threonine-protein kinase
MPSLLTIVFTDVVESSATKRDATLGQDSRERDHAYLEKVQSPHFRLIRDCSKAHSGREVSTIGDAFYLIFEDPVEAVRCAVDIQQQLSAHPIETPRGPLRLRIGIHSGYPEWFEESYHGTDVDKAARVEAMATAQQILLSSTTYELVQHMTDVKFHRKGEFVLKGVDRVVLWEVAWDGAGPRPTAVPPLNIQRRKKQSKLAGVLLAVMLLLAGAASYHYYVMRKAEEAGRALHGAVKGRRSVAVLGFKNLGRPEAAWLSTALAEELTTELAAGEQLRTIPGENVAQMKINLSLSDADSYAPETLTRVRSQLAADDLVLGSYLDLGGQLRLDVCVQDTISRETICKVAETGTETNLFDLVSKTGDELRHYLGAGEVTAADASGVRASAPSDSEAARLYAEGLKRLRVFDALGARNLLEKAMAAEPDFALVHSALSQAWMLLGYNEKAKEQAKEAFDFSTKLPPNDRLWIEGRYRESGYEWDRAIEVYKLLVTAAPDDPEYRLRLAKAQISAGKGGDAFETVAALRQLPEPIRNDPRIDLVEANAADSLGDFKRAQAVAAAGARKADNQGLRFLAAQIRLRECWVLQNLGDFAEAGVVCQSARDTFELGGDLTGVANVENSLANKLAEQGDIRGAQAMYGQALLQYRTTGNRGQEAWALNNIATLTRELGDYDRAIQQHLQALEIFRETGSKGGIGTSYTNLAINYEMKGDLLASRRSFDQALLIQRELGDKRRISLIQSNRAILLYSQGELKEALAAAEEALTVARLIGNKSLEAGAISHVAAIHWAQNDLERARKEMEGWLQLDTDLGRKISAVEAQLDIARLSLDEGHPETAETLARGAVEQTETLKDTGHEVNARTVLALSVLRQGRIDDARREISQARKLSNDNKDRDVDLAIVAARIQAANGASGSAKQALESCLAEAKKQGRVADQFAIRLALGEVELRSGAVAQGRSRLVALRKDAEARGFLLIAAKANEK